MLKYIEDCFPSFFCEGGIDLIKARITCYAECYGFDKPFADFWYGEGVVVSRYDSAVTVWADNTADFAELREFLDVIGAYNIVTYEWIAKELKYTTFSVKRSFAYRGKANRSADVTALNDDCIRSAYRLVSESISDSFKKDENSYMAFLSDYMYRKNRGHARGYCVTDNNAVIAVGFTAAETEKAAILSGISCKEKYRGCGLGGKIVLSLATDLSDEGKQVFVIALNESASGFYMHIGFEESDAIAYITL